MLDAGLRSCVNIIYDSAYTEIYNPQDFINFIRTILKITDNGNKNSTTFTLVINDPLELVQTMPLFLYTLLTLNYEIHGSNRYKPFDSDNYELYFPHVDLFLWNLVHVNPYSHTKYHLHSVIAY